MKIRSKLILVGAGLALSLLISVLFSIFLLITYIRYENVKIEAVALQETAIRSRYYLLEMLVSTEPTQSIISDYRALEEKLNLYITELGEDYLLVNARSIQNELQSIKDSWEETRELISTDDIISFLSIREEAGGDIKSLLSMQTEIEESGEREGDFAEKLDNAINRIILYENSLIIFIRLLENSFPSLSQTIFQSRNNLLLFAITIPIVVLIIAFSRSLLFIRNLNRKLSILNDSLSGVIRGDFSIRMETEGDDEFTSLAGSVNAFTKTLGDKLESFRLIMHDTNSILETELKATQLESTLQIESTLLKLAMREATANGAALYRVGSESEELVLSVAEGKFRPPFAVSEIPYSLTDEDIQALLKSRAIPAGETILGESASYGKPIIIRDVGTKDGIDWKRSEQDPLYLASIIVAPLKVGSTVIGILTVTSNIPGSLFTDLEYANLQSFTELAAISLDNIYKYSELLDSTKLERDIGIAEEIQQELLPGKMPGLSGASVACLSRNMKGLYGDFFDVYPINEEKVMLVICEIVGRGIPASLVMTIIRTLLRIAANTDTDALSIINKLNQDMAKQVFNDNYASIGVFLVDSNGKFTYSSAAQDSAKILRSSTREIEILHIGGIPIGIDKNAKFQQTSGELGKEDLVFFHSDGIPESRDKNGNEFGIERLIGIVKEQSEKSPAQLVDIIREELENFEQDTQQKDDQTAIIFKFSGKKTTEDVA